MTVQITTQNTDLFNEALIKSYVDVPRFVNRGWLWRRVQTALDKPDCRFVLLTAEPGAGKSAFMAWLARNHPKWPRYFIRQDQHTPLEDGGARGFLEKTGFQLAARFPEAFQTDAVRISVSLAVGMSSGHMTGADVDRLVASPFYTTAIQISQDVIINRGTLTGIHVRELVTDPNRISLSDLQRMALLAPALAIQRLGVSEPIVILLDALDELRYRALDDTVLAWLTQSSKLPANVRILVTSRPDRGWLSAFRSAQRDRLVEETIPQVGDDVRKDLSEYAERLVLIPAVESFLLARSQPEQSAQGRKDQFVTEAVEKAKGNLGFLDAVGRAIDQAIASNDPALLEGLLELRQLPETLQELYGHFLKLLRQSVGEHSVVVEDPVSHVQGLVRAWTNVYRTVLSVLAVAMEPLTPSRIHHLGRMLAGVDDVSEAIGRLRQFLHEEGGHYTFYHATLPEFLVAETTRQNSQYEELAVDPFIWHGKIVALYRGQAAAWDDVDWNAVDDYGLQHLARHLFALRDDPAHGSELYGLICWPLMEAKRVRTGSDRSFAGDVNLALQKAASPKPPNWPQLVRNSLLYATLGSLAADVPPHLLALLVQVGRVHQAEGYAALLLDTEQRSEAYQQISEALLAKGDSEQAITEAQRITVAWRRAIALLPHLDRMNGQPGVDELVNTALTEIGLSGQGRQQSDSLQALAVALAETGKFEQLNRIFAAFVNEPRKSIALQMVIRNLGNVGKLPSLSKLFSWVDALRHDQNKVEVFTTLVQELIRLGDSKATQYALHQLTALGLEKHNARIIAVLARYVATQGTLEELNQLQSMSEQVELDDKLYALSALARASAQMGDRERVSNLAPQIVALGERAEGDDPAAVTFAQSNIAETLAAIGAEQEAKRAIEKALMAAHRTRFDPRFGVTGDELLGLARILAHSGAVDSALALAEFAARPADRVYVRSVVAATLTETGANERAQIIAEEAEAFTRDLVDEEAQVLLVEAIASAQLRLGNREKAADLLDVAATSVQSIEDVPTRVRLLSQASTLLVRLGFLDRARDIATRAAADAAVIEDTAAKFVVLGELAAASPRADSQSLMDQAAQLADEIRDQTRQISNLDQLVEVLSRIGLTDHALEIASSRDDAALKRSLLIAIMRGTWSQDPEVVRQAALRCRMMVRDIASTDDKAITLEFVTRTLLVAKAYDEALAVAESIEHPDLVPQAFAKIAHALAQTEEKQRAQDLALRALQALTPGRDERIQTRVLCDVALASAHLGQERKAFDEIGKAEEVATAIGSTEKGNDQIRTRELIRVAETLHLMGESQRATDVAQRALQMLTFHSRIAYGLAEVVRARALLGDFDGATELLHAIEQPLQESGSVSDVVEPLLRTGKLDEVLTLAERIGIDDEGAYSYMLTDVAAALSKSPANAATIHIANRVLQLMTSVKLGRIKALALGDIASFFVTAGEVERPKALSREALAACRTDKDVAFRKQVLEKVAGVFGRVGDRDGLELALESAATLEETKERLNAQIVIAQTFLEIEAPERTIEIASRAIEFTRVEGDKSLYAQAMALGALSQVMADLGEQEQALALAQRAATAARAIRLYADQVGGVADKDGALAATAQALAHTNRVVEAVTIADVIDYKLDQVCILREAAKEFMQVGSRARARRMVERVKTVALKNEEKILKAYLLCAAAQAIATIGDRTGARTILRRVHEMERLFENMANKALVWSVVSQVFANLGDERLAVDTVQTAWDTAQDTPQGWDRIWSLIAVGNAMTHVGMNHEASLAAEQALALLDVVDPTSNENISRNLHLYPITRFNTTFARIANCIPWRSELAVLLATAQLFKDAGRLERGATVAERAFASADAISTVTRRLVALSLVSGAMIAIARQEEALLSLFTALELAYRSGRQYVFEVLWCGAATIGASNQGRNLHEVVTAIIEIVDRWPPKPQTLEQATRRGGFWNAQIVVAGRDKFE